MSRSPGKTSPRITTQPRAASFAAEEDPTDWNFPSHDPTRSMAHETSRQAFADDDEFYVSPPITTFFIVWFNRVFEDVLSFCADKPHLSSIGAIILLITSSPFLALMATVVCLALLGVLFLTCVEGTLIAVFMFLLASFVISTGIVSMMTSLTLYFIYSTFVSVHDHYMRMKLGAISVVNAYTQAVLERKKIVSRAMTVRARGGQPVAVPPTNVPLNVNTKCPDMKAHDGF